MAQVPKFQSWLSRTLKNFASKKKKANWMAEFLKWYMIIICKCVTDLYDRDRNATSSCLTCCLFFLWCCPLLRVCEAALVEQLSFLHYALQWMICALHLFPFLLYTLWGIFLCLIADVSSVDSSSSYLANTSQRSVKSSCSWAQDQFFFPFSAVSSLEPF